MFAYPTYPTDRIVARDQISYPRFHINIRQLPKTLSVEKTMSEDDDHTTPSSTTSTTSLSSTKSSKSSELMKKAVSKAKCKFAQIGMSLLPQPMQNTDYMNASGGWWF
ncbi:hypothetical protein CKM354_000940500 [Cercospora kikuchii]|uniref:Uncharacterized protein n=1 Tax=Cercospora kikuchii TaxID=84275 RepID=A0A9P3CXH5_9PEZI|nr:uncharacterized protein CKM354_000940500 [Cercospora kikuchii]GIZ46273.1 hypothetical protein CKM354_000940500 [Cercospora kikuchii]